MLDIKVSAALLGYTQEEQRIILSCFREQKEAPTVRLRKGVGLVADVYENHVEVVEGYAGFPIEKALIDKNKQTFKDDRNIGRVVTMGGNSMVITGKKSDGRYSVVGKKGEKTAKRAEDLGLNFQREHIDIEDLHQMMVEKMDGKDDNGFKSCWKGYEKQGTKMKGGKEVNDCVKEAAIDEAKHAMVKVAVNPKKLGYKVADVGPDGKERNVKTYGAMKKEEYVDEALTGERYKKAVKKPGGIAYSRMVSADPKKRATRGGRGGESDFGAGDRGSGNKSARRAGTYQEEYVDEATAMAKRGYDEAPIRSKIAKSTGGGKSADRATALADRETYGNKEKKAGRENLARKQRGDFRNTTSSSPGLHGYGHKSDDPKVKAKQAARGAQRGALTPNEKKSLNREEFEAFIEEFIDFNDPELDTLTFEELEEICTEALLELDGELLTEALEFIDGMDLLTEVMDRKEIQRRRDQAKDRLATSSAMNSAASKPAPKQRDAGAEARQRLTSKSSSDASPASGARREKVKAALKTAGSAIKKGLSATKSAAKKAVGGASEVAGAAAGGFRKGYSDARGKSEPKRSDSGSQSSERVSGSSSSSSSSSSTSGGEGRVRLRDRLKSGIKSAIGSAARVVSRKARSVARRLGEEQQPYSWREAMGVDE